MFEKMFASKQAVVTDPIQDEHERLILKAKTTAKTLAQKNLPKLTGETLAPYIEGLRNSYQSMYSRYNSNHQAESLKELTNAEQTHSNSLREQLEGKVTHLKDAIRRATLEREAMPEVKPAVDGGWKVHLFLLFLAMLDATFCKSAFSMYDRSNNLFQLIVFVGMVALFSVLPVVLVKVYRSTKESPNRYFIWGSIGFVLIAGWTVLGIFRSTLIQNIGSTTLDYVQTGGSIPLNPLFFVAINLMFTLISCLCYAFYSPNDEEKSLAAKTQGADSKLANLERQLQAAEENLSRIPDRVYQGHLRRSESAAESKRIGERISALYKECISIFIEENTIYRSDLGRPACFDSNIPDLNFSNVTTKTK
jgi:hypothetical protein